MSLRSKRPLKSKKPITTKEEVMRLKAKGLKQHMIDHQGNIIEDKDICGSDGTSIDTNLVKLGSPESGVLVGSVKMRGTELDVSPDQIMHKGKVFSTQNGAEIPYSHGNKAYMNAHIKG